MLKSKLINIIISCLVIISISTSCENIDNTQDTESLDMESIEYTGNTYKIIEVDGGDLSGDRQPNVAVDVGFGDRIYWALTNEYGQLVYVIADEIILQDDSTEPVNSDGRYYDDEAKVPGTEQDDLDEGHVIADSLGGVSNAYNITPQNSTLKGMGIRRIWKRQFEMLVGVKTLWRLLHILIPKHKFLHIIILSMY